MEAKLLEHKPSRFIEGEISQRLRNSPYHELRHVRCFWHEGIVTLRGRVSSYYLKQLAQTEVQAVDSVEIIHNQLEVACL